MKGFIKKTELRIILNESDSYKGHSLCRLIVEQAFKLGINGATVMQTKGGFGSRQQIHTSRILRLSTDLPIVISLVDEQEKLLPLVEYVKERYKGGLISMQDIWVNEK